MNLLETNEKLPSVRLLASALQINPMTISKAFSQLEIEGVLIRKRGVGMLVAEQQSTSISKELEASLVQFIKTAQSEKLNDDEISTIVQQYLSIHTKENNHE